MSQHVYYAKNKKDNEECKVTCNWETKICHKAYC